MPKSALEEAQGKSNSLFVGRYTQAGDLSIEAHV
jgi:hypothetical protein